MGFCAAVITLCVRKASDLHTGLLLIYAAWTERLGWAGLWWAGYQWGRLGNIGMPGARVEGSGRSAEVYHTYRSPTCWISSNVIYFGFFFLCGKCTDILLFGDKFVIFITFFLITKTPLWCTCGEHVRDVLIQLIKVCVACWCDHKCAINIYPIMI